MPKVSQEALISKTIDAGNGTIIKIVPPAQEPAILSDLHLVELGLSKDLARATMRAAGGRDVGKRVLCTMDRVKAYLSANDVKPSTPAAPKPTKTTPKKGATTAEILAANGCKLRSVAGAR